MLPTSPVIVRLYQNHLSFLNAIFSSGTVQRFRFAELVSKQKIFSESLLLKRLRHVVIRQEK